MAVHVSVEPVVTYATEAAKARRDVLAPADIASRNPGDPEKRVRLAYRRYHFASLTGDSVEFSTLAQEIATLLVDYGPQKDICLIKGNVAGPRMSNRRTSVCPSDGGEGIIAGIESSDASRGAQAKPPPYPRSSINWLFALEDNAAATRVLDLYDRAHGLMSLYSASGTAVRMKASASRALMRLPTLRPSPSR